MTDDGLRASVVTELNTPSWVRIEYRDQVIVQGYVHPEAANPDGLRAEVERLRGVCDSWGSNYQSWVYATRAAEAREAALRAGVEALRDDLRRAYPSPAPYTTESTALARLDALLADPTTEADQ